MTSSKRRWPRRLLIALLIFAALFFTVLPLAAERIINRHSTTSVPEYSAAAEKMRTMFVADLHADSLLWGRDLLSKSSVGQLDVPRLIEGGVALQAFTVVSKTPVTQNSTNNSADTADIVTSLFVANLWPTRTWGSLFERAIHQANRFEKFVRESNGALVQVKTEQELEAYVESRVSNPRQVAGFLGIEGLQVLEGDFANLERLFDAGYRMMAPTHFFDTAIGGSAHGLSKGGLTKLGRQVIVEMQRRGILVDLAHASAATISDVLQIATKPVVVSHTGVKGTCDNDRNLSDADVQAIAKTGGVVGIGFWSLAVCGKDAVSIARAIDYVVELVGIDHVALGSDFDGAVATPFDTTRLDAIVAALVARDYSDENIEKIMGQNTLRVLLEVLPR